MTIGRKLYTGADAFMEGAATSQKMWDSIVNNRLTRAKSAEQEAKNPYVGQQSAADLLNQQNINKWYGPKAESEIGLQGANAGLANQQSKWYGPKSQAEIGLQNSNAALNRQEYDNPGLRGTEFTKEQAILDMIAKTHPELVENAHKAVSGNDTQPDQNNQQLAVGQPDSQNMNTPQQPMQGQAPNETQQQNAPPVKPGYNQMEALKQHILARIDEQKANAAYKNSGLGGRGGVNLQQQKQLQADLKRDNPNLTDDQVFEAAGNLLQGKETLDDGTPFKVSGMTQNNASKVALQGTTSALATQSGRANQAEAELGVLNDYAQKGLEPYGDTFLGMSPKQIADTFKKDTTSQLQLGKFVASQALQYEAAQNRIRLANGQPGVSSTKDLMRLSGQTVDAKYPKLSYTARKEAARFLDEALRKGLEARNKMGLNINQDMSRDLSSSTQKETKVEGKVPPKGTVWMQDSEGNKYAIPLENVEMAKKPGPKGQPPLSEVG